MLAPAQPARSGPIKATASKTLRCEDEQLRTINPKNPNPKQCRPLIYGTTMTSTKLAAILDHTGCRYR
jgi:hypothetical protein